MLEFIKEFAPLANLLLIPALAFVIRIDGHIKVATKFMGEAEKRLHKLTNTVQIHETEIAVIKAREEMHHPEYTRAASR